MHDGDEEGVGPDRAAHIFFACMMETRKVSGLIARRTSSGSMRPSSSTPTTVTSKPSRFKLSAVSRTAWCSIAEVITCFFLPSAAKAAPFSQGSALDGHIVGLGTARGEDYLLGGRAYCRRHTLTRQIDVATDLAAE